MAGRASAVIVAAMLSGCAAPQIDAPMPLAQQRFSAAHATQPIAIADVSDLAQVKLTLRRYAQNRHDSDSRRRVEAAAEPFLYGSPVGRRFLAAAASRALAQGHPAAQCPAAGLGAGAASPEAAAEQALTRCLAALDGRAACGCRLLALDDAVVAESTAFAYAPGVSGRLVGGAAVGVGGPLAVEERATQDPARTLIGFFDASGPVAIGEVEDAGSARLILLATGAVFEGAREREGWARGRITERLLLTGPDGARLIALIGFEPADIVARGASLADWPKS